MMSKAFASGAYFDSIRRMPRTTLDIAPDVLAELRRRRREEGRTLGELTSELLSRALADEVGETASAPLRWKSQNMRARVDLEDKDALRRALGDR